MSTPSRDESLRAKILSVMNAGGIGWPARLDAAILEALAAARSAERERCAAVRIEFIGETRDGVFIVDEEQTQARHAQNLRAT